MSIASYLLVHNKCLIEFHACSKPSTYIKIWCHLLVPVPTICQFLHPSFKLLLVPANITENFPGKKTIIVFFSVTLYWIYNNNYKNKVFCMGNWYLVVIIILLYPWNSRFHCFGAWGVTMFSNPHFKCCQTRGRLWNSLNDYQKLYTNRVRWSKKKLDLEKNQFWKY